LGGVDGSCDSAVCVGQNENRDDDGEKAAKSENERRKRKVHGRKIFQRIHGHGPIFLLNNCLFGEVVRLRWAGMLANGRKARSA